MRGGGGGGEEVFVEERHEKGWGGRWGGGMDMICAEQHSQ